jgi:hypothetical protein
VSKRLSATGRVRGTMGILTILLAISARGNDRARVYLFTTPEILRDVGGSSQLLPPRHHTQSPTQKNPLLAATPLLIQSAVDMERRSRCALLLPLIPSLLWCCLPSVAASSAATPASRAWLIQVSVFFCFFRNDGVHQNFSIHVRPDLHRRGTGKEETSTSMLISMNA